MTTEANVILELDPREIIADPNNPPSRLRNLDELAANIALNGVLQPITVREIEPKGTARYMVVYGHRRHAAALKAKRETVPAILDGTGDEKQRTIHQLVENIQRVDLSAVERAKGIQHALDLGLTTEDVAAGLSVPATHVEQASLIAKSPLAAKQVAKETEALNLTFDQALGLAEFTDDEGIYSNLIAVIQETPGEWEYEIEHYRRERQVDALRSAATSEWTEKGYTILDSVPYNVDGARLIEKLKGKGKVKTMTSAAHATCPGRAVRLFQTYNAKDEMVYEANEYCLDFAANGHEEISPRTEQVITGSARSSGKSDEEKTLERRTNLAMINAGKVAEKVRREFVTKLLARKSAPAGTLRFAAEMLVGGRPGYRPNFYERYQELSGVTDSRGPDPAAVAYVKKGTDQHIPLGMLAFVAAEIEGAWAANTWARSDDDRKAYLAFLVDKCGYTPSLVEKVTLGKAKPADVLKDADERRAKKGKKA